MAACDREESPVQSVEGYLGIDLGIANIAVDSDDCHYSGSHINRVRHRHQSHRKKLQANGSRSAKRKLKRWSGKEARFAKDVNHCISKGIVSHAKCTKQAIVIEDLTGIRERAKAFRRAMRYRLIVGLSTIYNRKSCIKPS